MASKDLLRKKALNALSKADTFEAQGDMVNADKWRMEYNKFKKQYQDAVKQEESKNTINDLEKAKKELADARLKAEQGIPGSAALLKEKQNKVNTLQEKASTISKPTVTETVAQTSVTVPGPDKVREGVTVTPTSTSKSTKTTGNVPNKKSDKTPVVTDAQQREEALAVAAGADFALPETIFNNVPSLKQILERYVKEDWTPDKLRKAIRDDVWFRKNSAEIKARYVQLFNYQDLVKTGQAQGTTDYEKQIATLERQLTDKARREGSALASDPAALRKAAENMYITNVGIDDPMTMDFIAAAIRPVASMAGGQMVTGYSGQALANYKQIQAIARANGFKVSDIVPGKMTEDQVLQGIATGKIDINRLAQDARKLASQGQPQYVRDLLGQGYDLDQIYSPYRDAMAKALELNPDQIDLTDPTLRMAISDKGDMNLYDFSKALRKDNRWQYTQQAKEEVSNATRQILQDFGFMG